MALNFVSTRSWLAGQPQTFFPSPFASPQDKHQHDKAAEESSYTLSEFRDAYRWPVDTSRLRFCRRDSCTGMIQAVLASVVAIVMLVSICSYVQRTVTQRLPAGRGLAESRKSFSGLPSTCTGPQEKTFVLPDEPPQTGPPEPREPPKKRWRKMAMQEIAGGKGFLQPSAQQQPLPSEEPLPLSSTVPPPEQPPSQSRSSSKRAELQAKASSVSLHSQTQWEPLSLPAAPPPLFLLWPVVLSFVHMPPSAGSLNLSAQAQLRPQPLNLLLQVAQHTLPQPLGQDPQPTQQQPFPGLGLAPPAEPSAPPRPAADVLISEPSLKTEKQELQPSTSAEGIVGVFPKGKLGDAPRTSPEFIVCKEPFVQDRGGVTITDLDESPSPPSAAPGAEKPEAPLKPLETLKPQEKIIDVGEGSSAPQAFPPLEDPLAQHPFYRVPPLAAGTVPDKFVPERALSFFSVAEKAGPLVCKIREIFLKPELDHKDTVRLVGFMERLMAHAFCFRQKDPNHLSACHAFEGLATRFLVCDSLLAGFSVLKQEVPGGLWARLADAMPHVFERDVKVLKRTAKQARYVRPALALSKAMGELKVTRKRLPPSEVIRLKKTIFCTPHTAPRFRHPMYDPWRTDCGEGSRSDSGAALFNDA